MHTKVICFWRQTLLNMSLFLCGLICAGCGKENVETASGEAELKVAKAEMTLRQAATSTDPNQVVRLATEAAAELAPVLEQDARAGVKAWRTAALIALAQEDGELAARSSAMIKELVPNFHQEQNYLVLLAKLERLTETQTAQCKINMKFVGMAFLFWAGDYEGQFPFNVSTNEGGSMEWCRRHADGGDRNAVRHMQIVTAKLKRPSVLVCPADKSKSVATDLKDLNAWNISYQLRTGPRINATNNPPDILLFCPVHRHICFTDCVVERQEEEH